MGLAPAGHGEVFLGATSPLGEILPKRFTQSFCIPQAGHRLTARLSAIAVCRFMTQPSFELVSPTFARDGAFTAITIFGTSTANLITSGRAFTPPA